MKTHIVSKIFFALFLSAHGVAQPLQATNAKYYSDGHGGNVLFPQGDISFADEVILYQQGNPAPLKAKHRDASNALSIPNYKRRSGDGYLSLGCGGILVVKFNDNALTDIEGPDLHIFEIGPAVEPTRLEISPDNQHWIMIGEISGGRADVDIAAYTQGYDTFRYLRLTDLKQHCGRGSPGSDIDAIGAIGSALRLTLDSGVIFNSNQSKLSRGSRSSLDEVMVQVMAYPNSTITVTGHTDNKGSEKYNMQLSQQRAEAVSDYFLQYMPQFNGTINSKGYGELRPTATNETEKGRQLNRRVEIIVKP